MICGHCKGNHEKVQEVKDCYAKGAETERTSFAQPNPQGNPDGATEKQLAFIAKLVAEKPTAASKLKVDALLLSKREASRVIDALINAPKEAPQAKPAVAPSVDLEDGMYVKNDTVIKVYHAVHGSGLQTAKVLRKQHDGTWKFEYSGRRILETLTAEDRMSEAYAKDFGLVYGICIRCAADLTREESIHVGYGPVCASHEGWWYPTKVELRNLAAARAQVVEA